VFQASDVKQVAIDVVKDPASSPTEKRNARKAIARINSTVAHREKIGRKPARKNFQSGIAGDDEYRDAVEAHRSVLDGLAIQKECDRILDSRDSSPLQRHNARKKLEALDGPPPQPEDEPDEKKSSGSFPRREDFGFLSGLDWPEFVASGKEIEFQTALAKWRETAPPPSDPKIAAFLDALDDRCFEAPARPAPQSVTPKPPIVPPVDHSLYCEHCAVAFTVCGCDKIICPICWRPKANCYLPCPNSRRRS
jgi:hypothetical protein